ncbi:RNA polymerase sigma factor [Ferrovibrio sp.]|uniref:RNA polymerase sigma factor n=1 Tax=Ferrovibrio sp. TaxID=1917215 RepID=UPI0025BE803B|nr:RNA polymerase sigma factor [Ferrovibrio sp.]
MPLMRNPLLAIFTEQRSALQRFLARRLGRHAGLAEDLTQEVWLRAAIAGQPVEAMRYPKSYLFRIASNLAIDHQRHVAHGVEQPLAEEVAAQAADLRPSPEDEAVQRGELRRLMQAVDRLPPRTREVFLLAKIQELSYVEIALRLGIARNTVMVHMTSALALLERHLQDDLQNDGAG